VEALFGISESFIYLSGDTPPSLARYIWFEGIFSLFMSDPEVEGLIFFFLVELAGDFYRING